MIVKHRNYDRLSIEKFGRELIVSGDLDPVYIALRRGVPDRDQQYRWLIAYWCFYHCGVASYMSQFEGKYFWDKMMIAALNEEGKGNPVDGGRWPRGTERRHARGEQSWFMVKDLRKKYGMPEYMLRFLCDHAKTSIAYKTMEKWIREHYLFGPWIAFKICDMLERVLNVPIVFDRAGVFMFKSPMEAAYMVWENQHGPDREKPSKEEVVAQVVSYLKDEFSDLLAPPTYDRPIGLQEIETVLCKFKSHLNGHYPLYNDITEIDEGLTGWGETADRFMAGMPTAGMPEEPIREGS